jgi:hypothetical protein
MIIVFAGHRNGMLHFRYAGLIVPQVVGEASRRIQMPEQTPPTPVAAAPAETALSVFCPHLPPIPKQSPLIKGRVDFNFFPCMGEQCAKYEGCQGYASPEERHDFIYCAVYYILDCIAAIPIYGIKAKEILHKLYPDGLPTPDSSPDIPAANAGKKPV